MPWDANGGIVGIRPMIAIGRHEDTPPDRDRHAIRMKEGIPYPLRRAFFAGFSSGREARVSVS